MENHGAIFWAELHVRDMEASKAFYAKVAGWTYDTTPLSGGPGDYVIAKLNGKPVAGFLDMNLMPSLDGIPPHWLTYVAVDDLDQSIETLTLAGGKLRRPVITVPFMGRIAVIEDAGGAVLAMMEPSDGTVTRKA